VIVFLFAGGFMLKLCGFAASNYYNKAKLAMLEKGVPFEEELVWSSQNEDLLVKSPMGKVPFLVTDKGVLTESQVLVEYIEAAYPDHPLLPRDPYEAAKVRELMVYMELHLELVARELLGEALFGGKLSNEAKATVKEKMHKGVKAFARIAKFGPFIAGNEFTLADCAAVFHFPLMSLACNKIYGEDLLAPLNLGPYLQMMGERPHVKKAMADMAVNFALMMSGK
jgi:glutathione S-transferase